MAPGLRRHGDPSPISKRFTSKTERSVSKSSWTGFPRRLPDCTIRSYGQYVAAEVRFLAEPPPCAHVPDMVLTPTADKFF